MFKPDPQASTAKLETAMDQLNQGITALTTSQSWITFLQVQARFHQYSFNNCVLIEAQHPNATHVAGFNTWRKLGRNVKKGERGIAIFAPMVLKAKDSEGKETDIRMGFKLAYVFDISQTEGEELPECPVSALHGDDQGLLNALTFFAQSQGWSVSIEDTGRANGYCAPASHRIAIHTDRSPLHQAKTLAHELGHALLHTSEEYQAHRADFELEAESIAFLVLAHFGLDSGDYSFGYIAHWQSEKNALETLKLSGTRIQKTARIILDGLESHQVTAQLAA